MEAALKGFVLYFLDALPLALVLLLPAVLLLAWGGRRGRRWALGLTVLATGLLFVLSSGPVTRGLLAPLEGRYPPLLDPSEITTANDAGPVWVVVLGSGHHSDAALPLTSQMSAPALSRLAEGIRLYRAVPRARLLLTGYGGRDPVPNAVMMARMAEALGVPADDIEIAPEPTITWEEALAARAIVGEAPLILVTSASHMPRALALFRAAGLDPVPAPTGHRAAEVQFLPSASNLGLSRVALVEHVAGLAARLRGHL